MGFWSRLRERTAPPAAPAPSDAPHASTPEPEAHDPDLQRLHRIGEDGGPSEDEALSLLRAIRKTPREGLALDGLVQQGQLRPLPEKLALAVASALIDRGDRDAARTLLATAESPSSLLVRADLLADDNDHAGAVAMIERALLRDFDLPGARDRHLAWRTRLGLAPKEARLDPSTATMATPRARAPFDLVREVARGGSGVVYAAKDRELGRAVALKMYHQPERDRSQLLHEGRVAVTLAGPGIVRVFDVEPTEGWLALEWASLGALRDLLRLPDASHVQSIDTWLPPLVDTLARVHSQGWVHHDVKPANILMSDEGAGAVAWLGDFGTARRIGEPSPPGSLGYVSPERLAGRASDPSDDVYGLGRVIEDVVLAMGDRESSAPWRILAALCVGPSDTRPSDGAAVAKRIATLPPG